MTFSLRASEGAPCAASPDGASRSSRLRRLTASLGLVSSTTAAFVALAPLAAQAGPHSHHHDDDSRASSHSQHSHAKHHENSDEPASHSAKRHPALVRVSTAKLRETPGTSGKTTALLDAGRSAVVIARKEGWVQLKLDSGRKGWVRRDLMDVAKSTVRDHDSNNNSDRSERHHDRRDSETADRSEHASKHSHRVSEIADASPRHATDRHADYNDRARHAENVRRQQQHQQAVASIAAAAHHSHDASHISGHASHVVHSLVAVATPAPKPIHIAAASPAPEPRMVTSIADSGSAENDSEMLADGEAGAITPARHRHETEEVRVASIVSRTNPRGERLVRKALSYRGTPYRMGATGNGAFDCSGFTMYLFGKEGASLPRTAAEQYERGQAIAKDQLQLGDLVFFRNTYKSGISHVGVYIGSNSFVHAAGRGRGVRVDSLSGAFYINHWAGARRPH